jgi:serine/threonine protein phosphatase PrpC
MPRVTVHVFGRTDVGRTREHNEDAFVVADLTTDNATLQPEVRSHVSGERGSLFMVADGMGGAAAGEIASAMAVDIVLEELRSRWQNAPTAEPEAFALALREATDTANTRIHQFAQAHPEHRGMGTTATIAGLLGDTLYLAQVGDSRAYLIRDGVARQITKDQSLMQKLVEAGEITPEEAERSDRRNIILQALGPEARIRIDLTHQTIRRGDTLVLCSDGLSGVVKPEEIAAVVREETDLVAVCKRLIDMANESGGPDNITVVTARFEGDSLGLAATSDEIGHRAYLLGDETPTIPMERFERQLVSGQTSAVRRPSDPPVVAAAVPRSFPAWLVPVLVVLAAVAVYVLIRGFPTPDAPAAPAPPADATNPAAPLVLPPVVAESVASGGVPADSASGAASGDSPALPPDSAAPRAP